MNEHPPTSYGGLEVLIRVDPLGTDSMSYVMQVAGFPSAEAAAQFLPRAWAGLTSLMLRYGAAYSTTFAPAEVPPIDPTSPGGKKFGLGADLLASADAPVIYPTDKKLTVIAGGTPTVQIQTPANMALQAITEGFDSPTSSERFADDPFRSAVELYTATLFEGSGAAQLLILSSALEMLAPRPVRHPAALELLKRWDTEITPALTACAHDEDASFDLDALRKGLKFLEHRAIRSSLRKYVRGELSGDADADAMAKKAVDAYDSGSLVRHGEGKKVDADARGRAIADLRIILKRIFARRLSLTIT